MGECNDGSGIEYTMCYLYEPDKKGECRGASGRKMRRVCIYCPNYERYRQRNERKHREREDKDNEKGD